MRMTVDPDRLAAALEAVEQGAPFSVCQWFPNEQYEYVRRHVPAGDAAQAFCHYTNSVGARMGFTTRVIVTDMLDQVLLEWKHGGNYIHNYLTE